MTQFAPMTTITTPVRPDTDNLPVLERSPDSSILMLTLTRALMVKREYGSDTEGHFVAWLCHQLPVILIDGAGNLHVDLRFSPIHRTLFTAHTDTVHRSGGKNTVRVDGKYWRADKGSALGADDGAGVALLCHMITAGVPGYYVFFRGEECGGIGSRWLAENMPELLGAFDHAVAFDRADYADVITHQADGRCCSDSFAEALATALTTGDDWYLPDNTGVYTDTAEFVRLVPECTNVSVGYKHQHGDREWQDIEFLRRLAISVVRIDWDALPTVRDPKVRERSYLKGDKFPTALSTAWVYGEDDEAVELDADTLTLMDVIEDAMFTEHYSEIICMMAKEAYPEEVDAAIREVRQNVVADMLPDALEALENGCTASETLLDLFYASTRQ